MNYNFTTAHSIPLRHTKLTIAILLIPYLTVLLVGIIGNVCVFIVVVKMPKVKTATKYFILNLAAADLLVLIFCLLPSLICNIYIPWVMGSVMCKAVPFIQGVSVCASVYSLAAISADRLIGIRVRRQVKKTAAWKVIVLIWMLAAGLSLPWLLYFELKNIDKSEPLLVFCVANWPSRLYDNIYFAVVNLGLCFLVPLVFISFCHLSIWLCVRNQQVLANGSLSQTQLLRNRDTAGVQKLVIAVIVGFAACWLPLYIIFIRVKLIPFKLEATEDKVLAYALPIAQWLGPANSCMNPIIYVFFNHNFRCTLCRLLRGSSADTAPN